MQEHLPGKAFNEMTLVYEVTHVTTWAIRCSKLRRLPVGFASGRATGMLAGSCAGYGIRTLAQQNGGNITLTEDVAKELKVLTLSIPMYGCRWGKQKEMGRTDCITA